MSIHLFYAAIAALSLLDQIVVAFQGWRSSKALSNAGFKRTKLPVLSLLLAFCTGLVGCSSKDTPGRAPVADHPDHIVIVIEENTNYNQLIDNPAAPYINSLANEGLLFTDSHGVAHPSQPNYIALFSGQTQGVANDRCLENDYVFTTSNLARELLDNDYTFAGYSETMPEEGYTGCGKGKSRFKNGSPLYARKHNPWVNWQQNTPDGLPKTINKTFKSFPTEFNKLPTVSFVIPNEDNDMHNGPDSLAILRGDHWLKKNMESYVQWAKSHHSLFILTYDEDDFRKQNRIATIFVGEGIKPGRMNFNINHYNVLRTIEKWYGLPKAGPAAEKQFTEAWNTTRTKR